MTRCCVLGRAWSVACLFWASASCTGTPADSVTTVPTPAPLTLAPTGIRRLTGAEYDRAASALLEREVTPSHTWPPETQQNGFTRQRAKIVDPVLAARLDEAAQALATQALAAGFADGLTCAQADVVCAKRVVRELGSRAFRRPLTDAETDRYLGVLAAGRDEAAPGQELALVLRALLQSPGMLYVTEVGGLPDNGVVTLDDDELASALSFGVAGLPPDPQLSAAARQGELRSSAGREAQARRLLGLPEARYHYQRFVEEWLGIAELARTHKSASEYPEFPTLQPAMLAETRNFVDHVLIEEQGSVRALLAGGFSVVPRALAGLYGLASPPSDERLDLTSLGRVGILQQASFLAAHAHETNSGPVLRGVTILRRVLCRSLPNPSELGIEIVPPAPDASLTTRERYASHAQDAVCASCHAAIDAVGFSFENFDALGRSRSTEAGKPIDTGGFLELSSGGHALTDSVELARTLAEEPELWACLARQQFRFMSGVAAPDAEAAFVAANASLPAEQRSSIVALALSYARSAAFAARRAQ